MVSASFSVVDNTQQCFAFMPQWSGAMYLHIFKFITTIIALNYLFAYSIFPVRIIIPCRSEKQIALAVMLQVVKI